MVELPWNWLLALFDKNNILTKTRPKAVLLVEETVEDLTFAVTYGASYFLIDKYCDKDFGFNFARRIPFRQVKATTLTTPNSNRKNGKIWYMSLMANKDIRTSIWNPQYYGRIIDTVEIKTPLEV